MQGERGKIVIKGNEFYEIDLECEKRKKEGKLCGEMEKRNQEERKKIRKPG